MSTDKTPGVVGVISIGISTFCTVGLIALSLNHPLLTVPAY